MLLLQAPESVEELSQACVEHSGRRVTGFSGPLDQVHGARSALGLANSPAVMDSEESLYAMNLTDLVVPLELRNGSITCRELAARNGTFCACGASLTRLKL
jgi:hypothetical protein